MSSQDPKRWVDRVLRGTDEERDDALREKGVLPPEELLAEFETLSSTDRDRVTNRAQTMRFGPTGMNDADALVAAMQQFHNGEL